MILNIGDRMTLIEITKQLINHIHFLKDQFFVKQLEQDEREYFAQVKKETEPIFSLLKNWEFGLKLLLLPFLISLTKFVTAEANFPTIYTLINIITFFNFIAPFGHYHIKFSNIHFN